MLLLDEPTNHLDIESLEWLEQTLVGLDAAIVLVAHDRWFLEAVGTAVLELEAGRSRFFAGTWSRWRSEQAAREMALGKAIDKQRAEIERMERFVERFRYKATKARQAQSRVKKLAKIERIERDPRDGKGLEFAFKAPERSGRVIFELSDGMIQVGGEPKGKGRGGVGAAHPDPGGPITLLEHAELWLERGEHVSLVGPNGAGQDNADRDPRRPARAGGRQAQHGPQRESRLPLPARRGAGGRWSRKSERAGSGRARHRPDPQQGALAAGQLPVLRRGRGEAARRALRRRAPPPLACGAGRTPAPTS